VRLSEFLFGTSLLDDIDEQIMALVPDIFRDLVREITDFSHFNSDPIAHRRLELIVKDLGIYDEFKVHLPTVFYTTKELPIYIRANDKDGQTGSARVSIHARRNLQLDDDDVEGWQDKANCLGVDPDLFFPSRGASTREAKEVCRGCVVRLDCLEFSLVSREKFGIWGGLSERERRRLRRQRA
jgi:WhiB family redox-sensing transcriptional regulator